MIETLTRLHNPIGAVLIGSLIVLLVTECTSLLVIASHQDQHVVGPSTMINKLELELISTKTQMSGRMVRNVLKSLERLYEALKDLTYEDRLAKIKVYLAASSFPGDSDCSLEALAEIDKLIIDEHYHDANKDGQNDDGPDMEEADANSNMNRYIKHYLINKAIQCNYEFEQEVNRVKVNLHEPQMLIRLRNYIAAAKECQSEHKIPLLYFDIENRIIPRKCIVQGFVDLLQRQDLSLGSNKVSSKKIRTEMDTILSKLKSTREWLEPLRRDYVDLINLVPELIDYSGHQTIGLLEASLLADDQYIQDILGSREEIIKKLKSANGTFLDKLFH